MLTPEDRRRTVVRIFDCWNREMLRALEQEIAATWAATPAQRAANDEQLAWVRAAALARRSHVLDADTPITDPQPRLLRRGHPA